MSLVYITHHNENVQDYEKEGYVETARKTLKYTSMHKEAVKKKMNQPYIMRAPDGRLLITDSGKHEHRTMGSPLITLPPTKCFLRKNQGLKWKRLHDHKCPEKRGLPPIPKVSELPARKICAPKRKAPKNEEPLEELKIVFEARELKTPPPKKTASKSCFDPCKALSDKKDSPVRDPCQNVRTAKSAEVTARSNPCETGRNLKESARAKSTDPCQEIRAARPCVNHEIKGTAGAKTCESVRELKEKCQEIRVARPCELTERSRLRKCEGTRELSSRASARAKPIDPCQQTKAVRPCENVNENARRAKPCESAPQLRGTPRSKPTDPCQSVRPAARPCDLTERSRLKQCDNEREFSTTARAKPYDACQRFRETAGAVPYDPCQNVQIGRPFESARQLTQRGNPYEKARVNPCDTAKSKPCESVRQLKETPRDPFQCGDFRGLQETARSKPCESAREQQQSTRSKPCESAREQQQWTRVNPCESAREQQQTERAKPCEIQVIVTAKPCESTRQIPKAVEEKPQEKVEEFKKSHVPCKRKNFIALNIKRMKGARPQLPPPRYIDTPHGDTHNLINSGLLPQFICGRNFARVPCYIEEHRKLIKQIKEDCAPELMATQDCSEFLKKQGVRKMSTEERVALLAGLKANYMEQLKIFQTLSLYTDTPTKKLRKGRLENDLDQLEMDIKFVQDNVDIYVSDY